MHIISNFVNRNPNRLIVWLAQSSELLEQAADEFEKAWASLGSVPAKVYRYWGGYDPNIEEARTGFLVAGFAKLYALSRRDGNMLLRLGDRAHLTVIDEAHQAIAPTYRSIISNLHEKKPGNALLGLTATPGRTWADIEEDATLAEFFGNRKVTLKVAGYRNPVHYLIENGYLAKATFRTLNIEAGFSLSDDDLRELSAQYDIPESILKHLAEDDQRNIRIITAVEELTERHSRTIVFAATVDHAHLISSILNLRGIRSFVVTGLTDRIVRERVIAKFKSSDPQPIVLCNYGVLTTGFDAPKTSAAVIARPTRSLVLYSQMAGRAIRGKRAGGNSTAEIVTVVDPQLPGFGNIAEAFTNWEDVWDDDDTDR
jgi:superfamily II DNA or RNA helicase